MSVILLMQHLFLATLILKEKKLADEEKSQIDSTSEMDVKSRKQNTVINPENKTLKQKILQIFATRETKSTIFFKIMLQLLYCYNMTKTWKRLKILTPKQMLQRKPIALA